MRAERQNKAALGTGEHMPDSLLRTGRSVRDVYTEQSQTVYRVAYSYMKNRQDAEDALQETFLRLIRAGVVFADERHEKAWLVLTVSNVCRDMLKAKSRRHEDLDAYPELAAPETEADALMAAILALPDKYKAAVYLHYYEGYDVREIASMLRQSPNTIKTWLSRARKALRQELGGDPDA